MLRPIRWNTFVRDLIVIQVGFMLYGLALSMIVRANLGTSTWLVLEVALAKILGIENWHDVRLHGFHGFDHCAGFARTRGLGNTGKHIEYWSMDQSFFEYYS